MERNAQRDWNRIRWSKELQAAERERVALLARRRDIHRRRLELARATDQVQTFELEELTRAGFKTHEALNRLDGEIVRLRSLLRQV